MTSEYLDIVDENNESTGEKKLRTEVHAQGLWHRTVHIYLFRKIEGRIEILVHLRSKDKDLKPNMWDTRFGGHVKAEETLERAIEGELHDEIGLNIEPSKLIRGELYKYSDGTNQEFTAAYYYQFTGSDDVLKFNDGEVQEVRWMDKNAIEQSLRSEPQKWTTSLEEVEKVMKVLTKKLSGTK